MTQKIRGTSTGFLPKNVARAPRSMNNSDIAIRGYILWIIIQLLILGSVLSFFFLGISLSAMVSSDSLRFLWLAELIMLPLCIFILIITLVFFTTIGYSFIQAGKADESDKRSTTIGIIIVTLGLITVACLIMTFIYSGALLSQTITASRTKGGSSISSSAQIIRSLILQLFYKIKGLVLANPFLFVFYLIVFEFSFIF